MFHADKGIPLTLERLGGTQCLHVTSQLTFFILSVKARICG